MYDENNRGINPDNGWNPENNQIQNQTNAPEVQSSQSPQQPEAPVPNFTMRDPAVNTNAQTGNAAQPETNTYAGTGTYTANNTYTGNTAYTGNNGQPAGQPTGGGGANYSYIPQDPVRKPKKKNGTARKAAGFTAAALLFGVVSGGTMFGVNYLGTVLTETESSYELSQTETLAEVPAETEASASAGASSAVPAIAMDVSAIVEKAMPSVVAINNTTVYQSYNFFGMTQSYEVPSSGSGIIIGQNDDELLIVTNNHVVEGSNDLKVVFIDETSYTAKIKGTDSTNDLAVIAVPLADIPKETMDQIAIATMGNSDELKVGEGVVAIGNALGYGQSVTVGYVSALNREVRTGEDTVARNLLQTDAAINPGNSGGALLNMQGEVVGINAAKYSSTEVEGMGYAIPVSMVQDIIADLMNVKTKTETVPVEDQGYLGIQGTNIDLQASSTFDMPQGVYVYKITEDGAAANSDLREKDIITKFDGQGIKSMVELQEILTYYEKGTTVTLTVQSLENGQYVERQVEITLGERPAE